MKLAEIKAARRSPSTLETLRLDLRDSLIKKMERQAIKFEPFTHDIIRGKYDADIGEQDAVEWAESRARSWHAEVIVQIKSRSVKSAAGPILLAGWNHRVPYCRNKPTSEMLKEAGL